MDAKYDGEEVIYSTQIAHVSFAITKRTEFEGFTLSDGKEYPTSYEFTVWADQYEERVPAPVYHASDQVTAERYLRHEIQEFEERIEKRRKGKPTMKQVYFLFTQYIPIPLDLTWGEASDLIDQRLKDLKQWKDEKFNHLAVGTKVFRIFRKASGEEWKAIGTVEKLTSNNKGNDYAHVKWDNAKGLTRFNPKLLTKMEETGSNISEGTN